MRLSGQYSLENKCYDSPIGTLGLRSRARTARYNYSHLSVKSPVGSLLELKTTPEPKRLTMDRRSLIAAYQRILRSGSFLLE